MKKMLILAMTMAMVLLAAAGVCETLRVGMECNYAPYNWTQSDASENAVAIAAGGYADGYDVRIAKIIADQLGMELEIVKTEWDGLTPALLSGNIDVIIAGMSPTAERRMTIDFTDSYYDTELTVVVRKDSAFAGAKSLADLAGAKITGQMSTFHYDMIDQIEGAVKMPAMETFPTMIVAVSSGAIDGYVADRPGAVSATSANPDLTYVTFDEGQGFTVSPDDAQIAVGVRQGSELKEQIRDKINETAKDLYGIENFADMVADETTCGSGDPEELLNFLTEKGHPVLSMEPFDM